MTALKTARPEQILDKLNQQKCVLIDVRTPAEFSEVHARDAVNIPLDNLSADSIHQKCGEIGEREIFAICRSGGRGKKACIKMEAIGLQASNVEGGTDAWVAANLPVIRSGRKAIALERQVRIAAGSMVAAGAILALIEDPFFALLPLFVGCGLVFSGVTDTCGMAMILARMPWNRATSTGADNAPRCAH